jgi:putative ATP-dependent endonuclease of the OLD family
MKFKEVRKLSEDYLIIKRRKMFLTKIKVENFRLLKESTLNLKEELSLLIGKNNSGKTSFIVLLQKFFQDGKFNFDDFPLSNRQAILNLGEDTVEKDLTIRMILEIEYDANDDLGALSDFILDLDSSVRTVKLLFEAKTNKTKLLNSVDGKPQSDKERYITKQMGSYISNALYAFEKDSDLDWDDRSNLVEKPVTSLRQVMNLQVVHAKRNVSSSDESSSGRKTLSTLTTDFYNNNEKAAENLFTSINQRMIEMDGELDKEYEKVFGGFLADAKAFLNLKNLKVISDLQSNEVISHSSRVVYGNNNFILPEHLNGLGFMNILYLLLDIQIKTHNFVLNEKPINLLIIEEPEAHTHPQMQYVFAREIKRIKSRPNQQTLITTHSSHIVSQCDFEDIRYFSITENENIQIKNFYEELEKSYDDKSYFKFLVQYLTLESTELFFADKIIFIEGTTERMLLRYFMHEFDKTVPEDEIKLAQQHISILEVGANAKVFAPFLEFLGIKCLIVTDIDTTKKMISISDGKAKTTYNEEKVEQADHTSNETLKYFLNAPEIDKPEHSQWLKDLKSNKLNSSHEYLKVAFQIPEHGYHARSFEDGFIHINKEIIKAHLSKLQGLKNVAEFENNSLDAYDLTNKVLKNKAEFASSILYHALIEDLKFETPLYLKEGLAWVQA